MLSYTTAALQGGYEGLWEIPLDQVQSSSPAECSSEATAGPPSYNHTAPPPPYTAHARLGEVSIHRSYHYDPTGQEHVVGDSNQRDDHIDPAAMMGWINDDQNDATRHIDPSYVEQRVPMETSEQETFHEEQSNISQHPLATSTPTSSLHELLLPANSNIFIKPLLPLNNNLLPVKAIPRLRPIRPQTLSAPNLFVSSRPPLAAHDHGIDSTLNNTLPRVGGHLPPLRRKPNMTCNSPRHVRSLSDGRISSPYYDNTLSRSLSAAGECEPISEVSCEPSFNDAIDNL